MRFLRRERATLEALLPGLDDALTARPLADFERPGSPGIEAFRRAGGPGLLVPSEHKGAGATALEAVRIQRAIGARSPSLAVATTMHHFSMASLVVLSETSDGFEWMLMEALASDRKLLASGFAEGRPGASILDPTMTGVRVDGGVRISGSKRPCSLAHSMDLLTASLRLTAADGTSDGDGAGLAIAMVPADTPGLTVTPFWGSQILAGAESDQVTLADVYVPDELIVPVSPPDGQSLDALQVAGFVWFELLMTASYLGVASALVERVLQRGRGAAGERLRLAGDLESAMGAVENQAREAPDRHTDPAMLGEVLTTRYAVQDCLARVVPAAVELLGGMAFITSMEVAYLAGAAHALGFHPPSRVAMADPLDQFLLGHPLLVT
jgi:alkylation response protein AidB-like acyl-CoA dehydrogenase